jgi:hypothetical protein
MEQVGRKTVLPVRVAISIEHKKIEDMRGALAGGKVDVAVETSRNNKGKILRICKGGLTETAVAVTTVTQEQIQCERERRKS